MKRSLLFSLFVVLSVASLSAQSAPGRMSFVTSERAFSPRNLNKHGVYRAGARNRRLTHVNFYKTPKVDAPGVYSASMTVHDLAPKFGGTATATGTYVLMGTYDTNASPRTFVPNDHANALNNPTNGPSTNLMVEPRDAICCAVDQKDGIYFTIRSSVTLPFPAPIKVTTAGHTPPLPTGRPLHPVPCFVSGVLVMIFANGADEVHLRQIELIFDASGRLKGAELQEIHVISKILGARPFAPAPVLGPLGNVRGLWLAAASRRDSDMYFQPGLELADEPMQMYGRGGRMDGGGICGGQMFYVQDGQVLFGSAAWLIGSKTLVGSNRDMVARVGVHNGHRPPQPATTHLWFSTVGNNGVISPIKLRGFRGRFALRGSILPFTSVVSKDVDDVADWSATVPSDPSLNGLRVSIQGLSVIPGNHPILTNTATLQFR